MKTGFLIHIENWFDHKWLSFSGKVFGGDRYRHGEPMVPSFTPGRILLERKFSQTGDAPFVEVGHPLRIHQLGEADSKKLWEVSSSAIFLWFSSNSLQNARGSIMRYVLRGDSGDAWFASMERRDKEWKFMKGEGISREEFFALIDPPSPSG